MTAQFKASSVYRDRSGVLVRLESFGGFVSGLYINHPDGHLNAGGFDLATGRYTPQASDPECKWHLLPGELHNVNGQWVPVAEEAPKTTGQFYDEGWNAAHDGLPFNPMGTRDWRDGWSDYHAADPDHKIRLDDELAAVVREAMTPEKVRPPLTWATPKSVDRWDGFTARYDTGAQLADDNNHPLQRMTDPSDPLHASAHLRKG